jgi:uncharacterized protein
MSLPPFAPRVEPPNPAPLVQLLRDRIPRLQAVYAFGSRIRGDAGPDSDLDMAVLVDGYVDTGVLWTVSGDVADLARCPVDLLDFRAASTVMQYQVLMHGQRWWARDSGVACYEAGVLSDKTELDRARSGVLADIEQRGRVYG